MYTSLADSSSSKSNYMYNVETWVLFFQWNICTAIDILTNNSASNEIGLNVIQIYPVLMQYPLENSILLK
jgi:hypothetical protein